MKVLSPSQNVIPQSWVDHFIHFEGKINHFYLDGSGIVTIGIGCVIPRLDADYLPLLVKSNKYPASKPVKLRDWDEVFNSPRQKASYYEDKVLTFLPELAIQTLFDARLNLFISQLTSRFKIFPLLPEDAQLVFLDMAFNLGIDGLLRKFPKFLEVFFDAKWNDAAQESHRVGIQVERNSWTKTTLESLEIK